MSAVCCVSQECGFGAGTLAQVAGNHGDAGIIVFMPPIQNVLVGAFWTGESLGRPVSSDPSVAYTVK